MLKDYVLAVHSPSFLLFYYFYKFKLSSYKVSGSISAPFYHSIVSNETLTVLNKDLSFKLLNIPNSK